MVCHACSGLLRADDGALCSECRERLRAARAAEPDDPDPEEDATHDE
jgi:hypothetical protein